MYLRGFGRGERLGSGGREEGISEREESRGERGRRDDVPDDLLVPYIVLGLMKYWG